MPGPLTGERCRQIEPIPGQVNAHDLHIISQDHLIGPRANFGSEPGRSIRSSSNSSTLRSPTNKLSNNRPMLRLLGNHRFRREPRALARGKVCNGSNPHSKIWRGFGSLSFLGMGFPIRTSQCLRGNWSSQIALERGLLNLGYQAIFTSPIQPYYSHLAENKQFFEPYLSAQSPQNILDVQLSNLQPGPLGDRFLLGSQQQLAPANENMGDNHVLRVFDAILSEKNARPVCLVMINAEATLRHLEDQRTLSGVLAKWNRLTSTNPNKILFCFDARNEATLESSIEGLQIPLTRSVICCPPPHPPMAKTVSYDW